MDSTMRDALNKALVEKKEKSEIETFVWKFPKNRDDENFQEEVRLIDCSEDQLVEFINHCNSMLYSKDKSNPGRMNVLTLIRSQRDKIGAELMVREMEEADKMFTRFALCDAISEFLAKRKEADNEVDPQISTFGQYFENLSTKYSKLTLQLIIDACTDRLGIFNNSHITKAFLLKRGIWFDRDDTKKLKEFSIKEDLPSNTNKLDIAKQYLKLREYHSLKKNPKGLTLEELQSMLSLKPCKIKDLTTSQLEILRYKLLFDLERTVNTHVQRWEILISQIQKIAKIKEFKNDLLRN